MQQAKKIINKDQQLTTDSGAVITERVRTAKTQVDPKITISNIIWYIYGVIAIVLALRFILKIAGANSGNAFVSFVYSVSGIFSKPFDTIFGVTTSNAGDIHSVFEPSIIVAILIYGLVAWGLAKLFTLNEPQV